MLAIEEVLRELSREEMNEQGLPPGFRFHPTDEELITFYLASKVFNGSFCGVDIAEVDLNRCEPWELPDVAKMGEREWYFFSLRDRKYPTGLRTNRATGAGYWKATGKDREVYNNNNGGAQQQQLLIGMKKTLVFYKGRAPRGEKTKWVMHEYRLDGHFSCRHTSKEEWVICRIYHKSGDKKNPLFQGRQGYHLVEACLPKLLETPTSEDAATNNSTNTANTSTLLYYQTQNPMRALLQGRSPYVVNHPHNNQENDNNNNSNHHPLVSQSHHLFPINGFQLLQPPPSFSPPRVTTDTTTSNKSPPSSNNPFPSSMLFKSLLSHQDYCTAWKEQLPGTCTTTVPKQCKTEANFSHFQLPPPPPPPQTEADDHDHQHLDNHNPYDHYQNPNMLFDQMDDYGHVLGLSSDAAHETSTSVAFNRPAFHSNMLDPLTKLPAESCWPLDA